MIRSTLCYFLLSFLFFSCDRKEQIPAFLDINDFVLTTESGEGTNSSRITEAKVTVNGESFGVFDLPGRVPVLAEGNSEVLLTPVIMQNGVATTRVPYPFYTIYSENINLSPEITAEISPEINYIEDISIWNETFDSSLSFASELNSEGEFQWTDDPNLVFEGLASAVVVMDEDGTFFFSETDEEFDWPSGVPVFLELNYSCNHPFIVGGKSQSGVNVTRADFVIINPTVTTEGQNWDKIYINLTDFISNNLNSAFFELYFKFSVDPNFPDPEIYIDNMKVVNL